MCQNFITTTDCSPRASVDVLIPALSPHSVNKQRLHSSCQYTVCFDLKNFYKKTTNSSHHGQTSTDRFGCLPHLRKSLSDYCVCVCVFLGSFCLLAYLPRCWTLLFCLCFVFCHFMDSCFTVLPSFDAICCCCCLFVCLFLGVCCGLH